MGHRGQRQDGGEPVLPPDRQEPLARDRGDLARHGARLCQVAREHAPQAIIAIDPFHVVALANRALDDVRRAYWNKLRELDDPDAARRFKDARWSLLKAPDTLNDQQSRHAPTAARSRR